MDFAALPPEVNSGRMYAGAGTEPMLAAAAGWDRLSAELQSGAASYSSVVSGLTEGSWQGPASASMAAAAATYVAWMNSAATQAERTANQARAAASAYEAAFAATVPPPLIAANRALLNTLIATNFLGINTAAIMATEAHYAEMWAQDAAAMYAYAGSSAAAATLTPFTAPQQNTNSAGVQAQSAAVTNSNGTSAGTSIGTIIEQILANVNKALEPDVVNSGISAYATIPSIILSALSHLSGATSASAGPAADATVAALTNVGAGLSRVASTLGSGGAARVGGAVSAAIGRAANVSALSVPPSWGTIGPATGGTPGVTLVNNLGGTLDSAGMPLPVMASGPRNITAGMPLRNTPAQGQGTTLHSLMRPVMLPRPRYVG